MNQYLDNELSEIERLDFENKILHDSELREEYNFQKDLIDGIKEVRRLELKARLTNIPINTPLYQTIGFKAIAIASITTGVGIGAYYLLSDNNNIQLDNIDLTSNQITLNENTEVPEVPKAITPIFKEEPKEKPAMDIITQEKPKEETVAKNTEAVEPQIIEPNVIQPDVVESFEDEDVTSNEINPDNQINTIDNIKETMEGTVEVSTVKDKKNKFHYKFFENKLYLLGSFDDMPYEIIELNSTKGKSYFLYYNNSYYKLNSDQIKPAPLVKIENDSLVNELKIIQSNQK